MFDFRNWFEDELKQPFHVGNDHAPGFPKFKWDLMPTEPEFEMCDGLPITLRAMSTVCSNEFGRGASVFLGELDWKPPDFSVYDTSFNSLRFNPSSIVAAAFVRAQEREYWPASSIQEGPPNVVLFGNDSVYSPARTIPFMVVVGAAW